MGHYRGFTLVNKTVISKIILHKKKIEVSTLMIGFNVGYGALFTKIWFVYTASIEKKKNSSLKSAAVQW